MEQPTFADLEYDGKKRKDPAGEISGTHGWTDSVGPVSRTASDHSIRRRAEGVVLTICQ